MGFMTNLFGGSGNVFFTAVFALGVVMLLIALSAWALRFVTGNETPVVRGRNRRLTIVDSLQIDQKRQVVIVRRDNVEHVLLTGGPQDVVLEAGIPVDQATALGRTVATAPHVPSATETPAPQPHAAITSVEPITAPQAARGAVNRLREFTRPLGKRAYTSLRHTGLMRSGGRSDVIPAYLDGVSRDSAKTAPLAETIKGADGTGARESIKAATN